MNYLQRSTRDRQDASVKLRAWLAANADEDHLVVGRVRSKHKYVASGLVRGAQAIGRFEDSVRLDRFRVFRPISTEVAAIDYVRFSRFSGAAASGQGQGKKQPVFHEGLENMDTAQRIATGPV